MSIFDFCLWYNDIIKVANSLHQHPTISLYCMQHYATTIRIFDFCIRSNDIVWIFIIFYQKLILPWYCMPTTHILIRIYCRNSEDEFHKNNALKFAFHFLNSITKKTVLSIRATRDMFVTKFLWTTMIWKSHSPFSTQLRKKQFCLPEPPGILLWLSEDELH